MQIFRQPLFWVRQQVFRVSLGPVFVHPKDDKARDGVKYVTKNSVGISRFTEKSACCVNHAERIRSTAHQIDLLGGGRCAIGGAGAVEMVIEVGQGQGMAGQERRQVRTRYVIWVKEGLFGYTEWNRVPEEKLWPHLLDMRRAHARQLKLHPLQNRNCPGYVRAILRSESCESLSSESPAVLAGGKSVYHLPPILHPLVLTVPRPDERSTCGRTDHYRFRSAGHLLAKLVNQLIYYLQAVNVKIIFLPIPRCVVPLEKPFSDAFLVCAKPGPLQDSAILVELP